MHLLAIFVAAPPIAAFAVTFSIVIVVVILCAERHDAQLRLLSARFAVDQAGRPERLALDRAFRGRPRLLSDDVNHRKSVKGRLSLRAANRMLHTQNGRAGKWRGNDTNGPPLPGDP